MPTDLRGNFRILEGILEGISGSWEGLGREFESVGGFPGEEIFTQRGKYGRRRRPVDCKREIFRIFGTVGREGNFGEELETKTL